ncbi:dihydrolipoyl dehydrogenase [Bradyrhizobium icense]|uniref:Dihydrolipoyl dehydrogenase n=1 Tax=Bradyrhizobium icense TaxID=1274631 RepID=A0A1B1UBK3_9BRAD|nr:dihydrolipoyl dehydrogenase [Bradyrhizobium icense]ANW00158.1 dihydrolipoyl dehydrogenase [Bradyrhizobium icense]
MTRLTCEVLVIGAGPGGYVCAIRAGQLGLDTIIVEKDSLGGTCLNVGCIPSKALIHAAEEYRRAADVSTVTETGLTVGEVAIDLARTMSWKDGIVRRLNGGVAALLRRAKVRVLNGSARLLDGKSCAVATASKTLEISAEHIVIATGSEPVELAQLPFGGRVVSSTEIVSLKAIPRSMVVIGAGYIGVELGMAYAKLGTSVTLLEAAPQLLSNYDPELVRPVASRFSELGGKLILGGSAEGMGPDERTLQVRMSSGEQIALEADVFLVSAGRKARLDGFGLNQLDLMRAGSYLAIDEQCRTSMRHVWAVGDVTGEPMLAHRAMAQGKVVAEAIAGSKRRFEPTCIPAVCYADPEIVTVGLNPSEAPAGSKTAKFPFAANGRSLTSGSETGFIRIVYGEVDHRVLGIQAVGNGVAELSAAFALCIEMRCRIEDVALTIHAHPTLGEAFQEAALLASGDGLHG